MEGAPVLEVDGLEVVYRTQDARLKALHDVTLSVGCGELVGIVGESGCGKSTLGAALLRLLPPNGEIACRRMVFRGRDLLSLSEDEMREMRGSQLAMIFQDPLSSLNPTFTVGTQMCDAQRAHGRGGRDECRGRAVDVLEKVGIPDAHERIDGYPHEFSGGMRQRIMIATALLLEPALIIADEPTSALDVTLEAQVLTLLAELRRERGTAIMLISHDLGVIAQVCDRVVVMYAGRVVEEGDVVSVLRTPQHPYTQALLASIPSRARRGHRLESIPGRVPSISALPVGCKFMDRCPHAGRACHDTEPQLREVQDRRVRCHIYDESFGIYRRPDLEKQGPSKSVA